MKNLSIHLLSWCSLLATPSFAKVFILETETHQDVARFRGLQNITCLNGLHPELRHEFTSPLFSGVSLELQTTGPLHSLSDFESCLKSQGVKASFQSPQYTLAEDPFGDESWIPTTNSSGTYTRNLVEMNRLLRSSSVHESTGVAELHRSNITGVGITIAFVDTGLDYYHRALGGGLGPEFKVTYGRDYSGEPSNRSEFDPYSECRYHGTHVTGIAAGKDPLMDWVGVAPGAKVEHYRVVACGFVAIQADTIIKAVLEAHERKVDVLSLSLSLAGGPFIDDPVAMVLTRIMNEGRTVCIVAAGNNGLMGTFVADSPAAGLGVLSVGASTVPHITRSRPAARFNSSPSNVSFLFPWQPGNPSHFPLEIQLIALTLNSSKAEDGCSPLPTTLGDLSNKALLVRRGGCKFRQKMQNLRDVGGKYLMIQDYDNGLFDFDTKVPGILGAGAVSDSIGKYWLQQLLQGHRVTLTLDSDFTQAGYLSGSNSSQPGATVAPRSSWGPPGGDMRLFPSLVAPGNGVMAPFPRSWGGYGALSGSSMAAPYVAGCVALIKQVRPWLSSQEIVSLLITTADPTPFSDGTNKSYSFLAPVWQQGGGNINPLRAIRSTSLPEKSFLPLNHTALGKTRGSFEVRNVGSEPVHYDLQIAAAVTVLTLSEQNKTVVPWTRTNATLPGGSSAGAFASAEFLDTLKADLAALLSFEKNNFTLQPGQSTQIHVAADLTQLQQSQNRCPIYGGYINIHTNTTLALQIPYGGVACSLQEFTVLEQTSDFPWRSQFWYTSLGSATKAQVTDPETPIFPIAPNSTFKLPGSGALRDLNTTSMTYPTLLLRLAFFSKAVDIDVIPVSQISAEKSTNGTLGPSPFSQDLTHRPSGFTRVATTYFLWTGQMEDGTWASPGTYYFRVCAVKPWLAARECVKTVPFHLTYL